MRPTRRQFVLASAAARLARGQDVRPYSAEMPNMALEYLAGRLEEHARRWDAERAKIRAAAQLAARNRLVRARLREMAGPFPPRTPLGARVTRSVERPGYRIENVLFQSRPDYWIPANLYIPARGRRPFPAIVVQRGHFEAARMSPDYQQLYLDLVKHGFVALAFDTIGQGERRQYYQPGGETFDGQLSPALEHCAIGGLLWLIGESAAGWFAWDAMRAVDYLASRPEVDRTRIGCADHSDTGWSALLFCALEQRIRCAALHANASARRWPVDFGSAWNLAGDPEEQLFPAARHGADLRDALVAIAPRPLLALVENPNGGFPADAEYLRDRYRLAGAADRFAVETARTGVDWPRDLRLATVRWFRRWLRGETGEVTASDAAPEAYTTLAATPAGSLRDSRMGQPVYAIIQRRAAALPPPVASIEALRAEIRSSLQLPPAAPPLAPRELLADRFARFRLTRVQFLSEPGVYVPANVYVPDRANGECVIQVAGDVTAFEPVEEEFGPPGARPEPESSHDVAQVLVGEGYTVVVAGVRGIGATRPLTSRGDFRGPWEHLHNTDVALAQMAWMLGDSLLAMRVRDVLRTVEYASRYGRVRLVGIDMGAVWALLAAAVDARVAVVATARGLLSFRALTERGRYTQAVSQFVPGMLKRFDLPQVAGAIAPRPLAMLDPTDALKSIADPETAGREYAWTRRVYAEAGAADRFRLVWGGDLARLAGG